MKEETTVKEGKVIKLCCFMYVIVLVVTIIIVILLGLILYEVQNQHKSSPCSEDVNSRLSELNAQQTLQIQGVCEASCSVMPQDPSSCVTCCKLSSATICQSQGNASHCIWKTVGNGGGCVSAPVSVPVEEERQVK